MDVSPKVNAQALAGLLAAVVATFLVVKFPGLNDVAESTKPLIVTAVGTAVGWVAGYAKRAVDWADRYVRDNQTL